VARCQAARPTRPISARLAPKPPRRQPTTSAHLWSVWMADTTSPGDEASARPSRNHSERFPLTPGLFRESCWNFHRRHRGHKCCGSIGECDPKWTPSVRIRSPRSLPASAGADDSHATFILIWKSSTNADKSAQCLTLSDANCPFSAHHSRTSELPYRRSGADSPGPFQGGVRALPQRLDSKPARVKVPQRHRHGARIGVDRGDRLLRKVQLAHLPGR
jgi:hypothetical protein